MLTELFKQESKRLNYTHTLGDRLIYFEPLFLEVTFVQFENLVVLRTWWRRLYALTNKEQCDNRARVNILWVAPNSLTICVCEQKKSSISSTFLPFRSTSSASTSLSWLTFSIASRGLFPGFPASKIISFLLFWSVLFHFICSSSEVCLLHIWKEAHHRSSSRRICYQEYCRDSVCAALNWSTSGATFKTTRGTSDGRCSSRPCFFVTKGIIRNRVMHCLKRLEKRKQLPKPTSSSSSPMRSSLGDLQLSERKNPCRESLKRTFKGSPIAHLVS